MKKILAILLIFALALCACEKQPQEQTPTPNKSESSLSQSEQPQESIQPEEEQSQQPGEESAALKGPEDYSEGELEFFRIIYRNYSTEEDLYTSDFVQKGFEHRYNYLKKWFELAAESTTIIPGYGDYGGPENVIVCPELDSTVYILHDMTEYTELQIGMTRFFILHNNKTGENKLIFANNYGMEGVVLCGTTLIMNERTQLLAVDLSTGEQVNSPLEFDFGKKQENGIAQYEVLGLGYDNKAEKNVLVYYDTAEENENQFAKVWLKVFEKDGKLIKTVDTGTKAMVHLGHFWYNASQISFPEKGKIKMGLPYAKYGEFSYECNYLEAAEEPELGEIAELWSKVEGCWYHSEPYKRVFFYISDGKPCINYEYSGSETGFSIFYVTDYDKISDTEYKIYTDDGSGKTPTIYINTEKPGDNKMKIGIETDKHFDEFEILS